MAAKSLRARIRAELEAVADPKRAPGMQAYMKSSMPYLGVSTTPFRAALRPILASLELRDFAAFSKTVRELWREAEYREERYAALAICGAKVARPFQTVASLELYEELVVTGAWWDTVDDVATHRIRDLLKLHGDPIKEAMRAWSRCGDMWKQRSSIICQVGLKGATDKGLLYECIEPSLPSKEFFLRKAIGWALRSLAWFDPDEVERYVREHEKELSGLSKREALKNVSKLRENAKRRA